THPNLFKILIGQILKNRTINIVLGKAVHVLLEPERLQPGRNLVHPWCRHLNRVDREARRTRAIGMPFRSSWTGHQTDRRNGVVQFALQYFGTAACPSSTDQVDGLPRLNFWSPPPSSTDVSTSEVDSEEVCQVRKSPAQSA